MELIFSALNISIGFYFSSNLANNFSYAFIAI